MMKLLGALAFAVMALADPVLFSDSDSGLSSSMALVQNGSATDIQMQIVGPVSAGWAGVAIGSGMPGALMFVMYPSASGQSVTVSVRSTTDHVMPTAIPGMQYQVTNSSVSPDGHMTADFTCYGCTVWPSGKLNTASTSQGFLYAVGPGSTIQSDDPNAQIQEHADHGTFTGNVAKAYGSGSDSGSSGGGSSGYGSGSGSSSGGTSQASTMPAAAMGGSNTEESSDGEEPNDTLVTVHAVLMCIVFYLLLPLGVITLRLPFAKSAAFPAHWMIQTLGLVLAVVGMIIAIYFSKKSEFSEINEYHQIIGLVTVSCLIAQPVGGIIHHMLFKKHGKRTVPSYTHMAMGWIIIFLGMLNAPFGLVLAEESNGAAGGLGAAGIVILLVMLGVSAWSHSRRSRPIQERK